MRARRLAQVLLIVVVAGLAYAPVLHNSVTRDESNLLPPKPPAGLEWLSPLLHGGWTGGPAVRGYHPLPLTSVGLQAEMTPGRPRAYHAGNVALHAAVSVGVFLLAVNLLGDLPALIAALWFAAAPIHVQAVASLAGRTQLFSALFLLAAGIVAIRASQYNAGITRRWLSPMVFAVFAALVLLSDAAAAAPLVLLALTLWMGGGQNDSGAAASSRGQAEARPTIGINESKSRAAEGETTTNTDKFATAGMSKGTGQNRRWTAAATVNITAAGILAGYVALRAATVGLAVSPPAFLSNPLAYSGNATRVRTALVLWMRQIGASLFAVRQFPDYSYSQIRLINSWTSGTLWLAITGLGLIFGVVLGARKHIPVLFGAVFAATAYLPHSNLLFAADAIRDNSSTYLPSIGTAVLLGGLFEILWHALAPIQKRMQVVVVSRRQIALIGVVALAGVVCMATDVRESRYWRNDRQLAAISVRRAPRSARAHYYSGWVAAQADEVEETEHQYQLALVIYPDYADAWGSLGDVLLAQGEIPQALSCFRHAYDLDPTEARFLALCDTALQTCKYAREAPSVIADRLADGLTDDLRAALKVDLAVAYLRLGHNTSASNILNDVLELHPSNALARFYYSQALRSRGLTGQADAELHLARELDGPAVEKAISRTPQLMRN